MDCVWRKKALERYPPPTVVLGPSYQSCLELVMDDNKQNTAVIVPIHNLSSDYIRNRPGYYFECCVLFLQLDKAKDKLRLFFDARGEADLRNPFTSSLGITVHRTHMNRRELRQSVVRLASMRRELMDLVQLRSAEIHDSASADRHQTALVALNLATSRLIRVSHELQEGSPLGFADLLTVLRPSGHRYIISRPGHYKGYLDFERISQIDSLMAELPQSYRLKREIERYGVDLVFCYANPVPIMPHMTVDYHPVQLFHVPPGLPLSKQFSSMGYYESPDYALRQIEEESKEDERARWRLIADEFHEPQHFNEWFT
jgi:hypothetical protein